MVELEIMNVFTWIYTIITFTEDSLYSKQGSAGLSQLIER